MKGAAWTIYLGRELCHRMMAECGIVAFGVYCILLGHAHTKTHKCCPSTRRIAKIARLSRNTVKNALQALQTGGFLEVTQAAKGSGKCNEYRLLQGGARCAEGGSTVNPVGGSNSDPGVGQNLTGVGQNLTGGGSNSEHKEITIEEITIKNPPAPQRGNDLASSFNEFWTAYPRKVAKKAAVRAWKNLRPSKEVLAQILDGIEHHKQTSAWRKDGGQFIPHPATFLNGRRWEDDLRNGSCPNAKPFVPSTRF